jgi:hypothetical protein
MDAVNLDQLSLMDLDGKAVRLSDCFQKFFLVIFLRHLA